MAMKQTGQIREANAASSFGRRTCSHRDHPARTAAMAIEVEADLDATGEIVEWRHSIWSNGHAARPGRGDKPTLLAGYELERPFPIAISGNPPQANGGGGDRNSIPLYDFPAWKIESHRLLTMPVRTSALRTLGAQGNVFAIECFLDEIAAERGEDPIAFRLRHLKDERARNVVRAAAKRAGWKPAAKPGSGYGFGYSRYKNTGAYCAAVAEIEGDEVVMKTIRSLVLVAVALASGRGSERGRGVSSGRRLCRAHP